MTALGPSYVKLGQFLATRPDVVGPVLARDLESLQDRMAPFPQAEAEAAVAAALDRRLSDVFVSFGPPVAAASIAQVHRAEIATADGRRAVAVKVLRPGVERRFQADLAAFRFVARNAEALSARGAPAAADRGGRHARPLGRDGDGFPTRGRRAFGDGGEHQGKTAISACLRSTGP